MSTEIVKSPMLMLQEQLDKGVSVQELKALMDLAERWQANQAEQAWNRSMMNCQRDMPALVKSSHNKHKDIWYAGFEQLDKQIRPIYLRENFCLCFTELESPNPEAICRMAVDILHVDGHVRRFEKNVHVDGMGQKGNPNMTPTQGDGSTASYARRYVAKMAFNLRDESDRDLDGDVATQALVTKEEVDLLEYGVRELTFLRGDPVDVKGLLRFADPNLQGFEQMNREQYLRVMNEMAHQREIIQAAEKKKKGGK